MLTSNFKEATEKKTEITDFSTKIVQIAIDFFYDRDVLSQITETNASEILRFSDYYDIKGLMVGFYLGF